MLSHRNPAYIPLDRNNTSTKVFTIPQRVGQEILRYVGSATPPYFVGQLLPKIPIPWVGMLQMGGVAANDVIGMILIGIHTKKAPLSGLRAQGGGHVGKGLFKVTIITCGSVTCVATAGYVCRAEIDKHLPELASSNHTYSQPASYALNHDAILNPLFGAI